jgi:hypothetical protein
MALAYHIVQSRPEAVHVGFVASMTKKTFYVDASLLQYIKKEHVGKAVHLCPCARGDTLIFIAFAN